MTECATCHQPILEGEMSFDRASDAHHTRASDCVAAKARRCAEIATEINLDYAKSGNAQRGSTSVRLHAVSHGAWQTARAICREFKLPEPTT